MTMGPDPMSRIFFRSVFFGMGAERLAKVAEVNRGGRGAQPTLPPILRPTRAGSGPAESLPPESGSWQTARPSAHCWLSARHDPAKDHQFAANLVRGDDGVPRRDDRCGSLRELFCGVLYRHDFRPDSGPR